MHNSHPSSFINELLRAGASGDIFLEREDTLTGHVEVVAPKNEQSGKICLNEIEVWNKDKQKLYLGCLTVLHMLIEN